MIRVASQLFHVFINGEVEGLLDNKLFSRSLLDLVRYSAIRARPVIDALTEASLIELLFSVCTKIRLDPDILPAWFHPERDRSQGRLLQGESRRSQFPLFYVLVQYVHHDGPVGDFARTGLLYLTETAGKSKSLETWMIESDLAPQMASGLGALYSRLSRNFPALEHTEMALPVLSLSDLPNADSSPNGSREQFQHNMKEFLTYLAFWQDTLNHCKSAEVADTLLDHFQVLFVQQLLYPSLLESSDVDGGSTAAVLSHLTRVLLALEHPELSRRMVTYLLASKTSPSPEENRKRRPRLSMSRRKSLDHLAALAEAAQSPSPDLFNLLDLIMMSLKSSHADTVNASLKLITVILSKHPQNALTGLFQTDVFDTAPNKSIEDFTNMLVQYFDVASIISAADATMDESYQGALTDVKEILSHHSCVKILQRQNTDVVITYRVSDHCKLLSSLLDLLEGFFSNGTLTNLSLTEALVSLASCDRIILQDWLMTSDASDQSQSRRSVTSVIRSLATKVGSWKDTVEEWNSLIEQRRRALGEEETAVEGEDEAAISQTPLNSGARSTGGDSKQNSRPSTPRGRSSGSPAFGSIDGTLSASPSHKSKPAPFNLAVSPLRQSYFRGPISDAASADSDNSIDARSVKSQDDLLTTRLPIDGKKQDASLNHILTNAIILQEFILEIAAIIQVRGTMFGEVDI